MVTNKLIETPGTSCSSPARKTKRAVNYAESDDEDEDDSPIFKPVTSNARNAKRRRLNKVVDESDEEYSQDHQEIEGWYPPRSIWLLCLC